jgi:hypothetical protein
MRGQCSSTTVKQSISTVCQKRIARQPGPSHITLGSTPPDGLVTGDTSDETEMEEVYTIVQ